MVPGLPAGTAGRPVTGPGATPPGQPRPAGAGERRSRTAARWRLVALVGVLVVVAVVVLADPPDLRGLRAAVAATGVWAPLVYLVASAALGAVFVPGPLLAAASGVLFGPVTGTVVTIGSAVASALLSWAGGRGAGYAGVRDVLGQERAAVVAGFTRRHGTLGVLAQRLVPGIPDSPLSWAFGALGLGAPQVGLGTLVGTAPRAFSYSALGSRATDPLSPLGLVAIGVWVLTALVGVEIGRRLFRAVRPRAAEGRPPS